MTILNNVLNLKSRRRTLRTNCTPTEKVFWYKVRNKQFHWLKFRRQHSIWNYILDFYCPEKKVCIEIDWDTHYEDKDKIYDEIRTRFLEKVWIKVIRFTNIEITKNIEWVMFELEKKIL
jgi:very-short-patch-repair endonuclease